MAAGSVYGNDDTPLPLVTHVDGLERAEQPDLAHAAVQEGRRTWRIESAYQYAKICNAVYTGVHSVLISPLKGKPVGEKVACGVTGPKGNNAPANEACRRSIRSRSSRPRSGTA